MSSFVPHLELSDEIIPDSIIVYQVQFLVKRETLRRRDGEERVAYLLQTSSGKTYTRTRPEFSFIARNSIRIHASWRRPSYGLMVEELSSFS